MNDHIQFALTPAQRRVTRAALAAADQLIYDDDCADDMRFVGAPLPTAPESVPIICDADGVTCRVEFDTSDPAAPRMIVTFVKASQ